MKKKNKILKKKMTTKEKEELKEVNLVKPANYFIYDNIDIKWGFLISIFFQNLMFFVF